MLDEKSILMRVKRFVAEYHGVDIEVVTPETDLDETLEGKSKEEIDWWEFLYYLGREFDLDIPVEKVGTVEQTAKYIEKNCNQA